MPEAFEPPVCPDCGRALRWRRKNGGSWACTKCPWSGTDADIAAKIAEKTGKSGISAKGNTETARFDNILPKNP